MKRLWKNEHAAARACARTAKPSWPEGATAGILIVAAACLAFSITLYHLAGPRDVFAESGPAQ